MIDPSEINGIQPRIEGQVCDELLVEEHSLGEEVTAPANVIHLRFDECWHRLYFDCGIVFWRQSTVSPVPYDMPELQSRVRIVDLGSRYGVRGERLVQIETTAIENGAEVILHFAGLKNVRFTDAHDVTTYST